MFCNWTIAYTPELVTIDPERGEEPGVRFHAQSDWDDDFEVLAIPKNGYGVMPEWCRAVDDGVVPEYFCDFMIDLAEIAVGNQQPGSHGYQVDLATREGNQTARELYALEQG